MNNKQKAHKIGVKESLSDEPHYELGHYQLQPSSKLCNVWERKKVQQATGELCPL